MRASFSIAAIILLLAADFAAAAEVQVPLDRGGRVQRVDAGLARRLGLFADRPGFQEARLFQLPDSSFVLEITSTDAAGLSRERVPLSAAGADSLRDVITTGLVEKKTVAELDQSGRPLLVTTTSMMGLFFYGWAVPFLTMENEPDEVIVGTYMVVASASTFVPLWLTRDKPVTEGAALLATYGATLGTLHGALLPHSLDPSPAEEEPVVAALGFSLFEAVGGFAWASRTNMRAGHAATIGTGGMIGTLYGLGFGDFADADKTGNCTAALVGSGLGIAGAALYAPHRDFSYGDASVMRSAGWIGGLTGIAIAEAANTDEWDEVNSASAMIGGAAGLVIGDRMVKNTEFSFGQGLMVDFCAIGGGLFALGIGTMVAGSNEHESEILWLATAAGTLGGFYGGYRANLRSAQRAAADRTSWRFDIMPTPPTRVGGAPGVMMAVHGTLP